MSETSIPQEDLHSFKEHLRESSKILALCGAGLSAASGLPTFRGAGGLWRSHDATQLATPEAFEENPGLVWHFYSYRRHMSLAAKPNTAHYALAEFARRRPGFQTLTQNVDGLSTRAGHPAASLHQLHGSLFNLRCHNGYCTFVETDNFLDPIVPGLSIPQSVPAPAPLGTAASSELATASLQRAMDAVKGPSRDLDISDDRVPIAELDRSDLPSCPQCQGLLRPGVVWFGEALPHQTLQKVDAFIRASKKIDLMLVIGTGGQVYPAAAYVEAARRRGAKVAVVNMDPNDLPGKGRERKEVDWFFRGDASVIIPQLLEDEIGSPEDYVRE